MFATLAPESRAPPSRTSIRISPRRHRASIARRHVALCHTSLRRLALAVQRADPDETRSYAVDQVPMYRVVGFRQPVVRVFRLARDVDQTGATQVRQVARHERLRQVEE